MECTGLSPGQEQEVKAEGGRGSLKIKAAAAAAGVINGAVARWESKVYALTTCGPHVAMAHQLDTPDLGNSHEICWQNSIYFLPLPISFTLNNF